MKAQKTDEFSVADEAVMRESCIRFITTLVDQIRQRLPDNITVLQKTSLLSVENALCVVKEPLIPLLEAMAVPPETIEKIQNQWGKITLLDWKQISSTQSFWCEVHSYKDACGENPFAELAGFAMSMLVLPYSNAEVERTLSQLNIVKSKLRNKLKPETTNAILVVRAGLKRHQKSCFDYELPAAVVGAIGTSATYVQPSHLSGPSTSTSGPVEMVSDDNSGDEDLDVFFVDLHSCHALNIAEIRVNYRHNIVVLNLTTRECLKKLVAISVLQCIPLIAKAPGRPPDKHWLLHGIDGDLEAETLLPGLLSTVPVLLATREGRTNTLQFGDPVPPRTCDAVPLASTKEGAKGQGRTCCVA
ncbi:hypothetical protein MRX96_025786 [Rhipicephalus microplus]